MMILGPGPPKGDGNARYADSIRGALVAKYGGPGRSVRYAEALELCGYGCQPAPAELLALFPF